MKTSVKSGRTEREFERRSSLHMIREDYDWNQGDGGGTNMFTYTTEFPVVLHPVCTRAQ